MDDGLEQYNRRFKVCFMNWKEKHDIVLRWINSCNTPDQLKNMLQYVKSIDYDNHSLIFMIRMKCYELQANIIVSTAERIKAILN